MSFRGILDAQSGEVQRRRIGSPDTLRKTVSANREEQQLAIRRVREVHHPPLGGGELAENALINYVKVLRL